MRVVFLGTGGYHPNQRRHTAGVLLPAHGVLLDAGSGTFRLEKYVTRTDLTILLSHAHLDHVQGLTYLLVPQMKGILGEIVVYGTPDVLAAIDRHLFAEPIFPVRPKMDLRPLTGELNINGLQVTHWPQSHPGGSRGLRLTDAYGVSLVYATDTTVDNNNIPFVTGTDLLIHECYFSDQSSHWCEQTGHSCTTPVAQFARNAQVGKLYLTHIDPQQTGDDPVDLAVARSIFPETFLAEDELAIEVTTKANSKVMPPSQQENPPHR